MSDNIIKNSNRNTKKHERINYVPEYKKLGLNPNAPIARTNKRINERVEQLNTEDEVNEYEEIQDEEFIEDFNNENNTFVNDTYELQINECMLIVYGSVIRIGSIESIKREVSSILNGTHPEIESNIELNDLVVVKRLNLRYGLMVD